MIAVRAGADTEHAVDADILRKLGKDGYVVNISRGSVIDQQALIAALTDQTIAGAGLDVYAKEPHAPDALTALPNVVLSPHIGGHTLESHVAMQDCVIANLDAFFAGKPLALCGAARLMPQGNGTGQSGFLDRFTQFLAKCRVHHLVRILLLASREELGKQPLPGVLAVAGTSVLAFRKPDTVGDHSFQDIRMDCSKGRKTHRFVECGRGLSGSPDDLDPVRDCRRPSRNLHGNASFHNGLILRPA